MGRLLRWAWVGVCVAACRPAAPAAVTAPAPGSLRADLDPAALANASAGKALFQKAYTPAEGMGPHFNFDRCGACHDKPVSGGHGDMDHAARLVAIEGDVTGVPLRALPGTKPLAVAPGTPVSVHKPPPLFGLGLVDDLPDSAIADHCGTDAALGIAGIANFNPGRGRVGRFGFKAHAATLADFVANALNLEMGLTNPIERDPRLQTDGDAVPDPDVPTATVLHMTDYVRALAPPAPPAANPEQQARFAALGCATCHRPQTAPGVAAYSDFCVHDLGAAFDNRIKDLRAKPSQWRTAPLWGLRWRDKYFHDDRAADLDTAVRMHGGEAEKVRDRYTALGEAERVAFLGWLRAL